jgi:NAD(P)H-dependent FMN reductase
MLKPLPPRTGPYRILTLSGSLRAESSNAIALQAFASTSPAECVIERYAGLAELPHFNPDFDSDATRPPPVSKWRAAIAAADGLIVSTPEYAHGVPGTLKNGFDWLVSGPEFPALVVALLNTSPRASHAQAALVETLATMAAELLIPAVWTVPVAGRPLTLEQFLAHPELVTPLHQLHTSLLPALHAARLAARRLVPPDAGAVPFRSSGG